MKTTLVIYYGLRALVLIATGFFAFLGHWESAVSTIIIFGLMLMPAILKKRYNLHLPFSLEFGIVTFIFLTLFLGEVSRFYEYFPLWDKLLHFQSGFLLGAIGYVFVYILNEYRKDELDLTPGFLSVFAVTFSLAIGALWEVIEFTSDTLWGSQAQSGLADTMWDLIADFIGALIISIAGYFWMHRNKRLPFTPRILKILRTKIKKPGTTHQV